MTTTPPLTPRVESLLTARLFLVPEIDGDHVLFESDLSGRISLYRMRRGGSVPLPLLPGDVALQQPHHIGGAPYFVFPKLDQIVVMIDHHGDENYRPHLIPREGGIPQPFGGEHFAGKQSFLGHCRPKQNRALLSVDPRNSPVYESFIVNFDTGELTSLGTSHYGNFPVAANEDLSTIVLADSYLPGDTTLYLWTAAEPGRRRLLGTPLEERAEGETVPHLGIQSAAFSPDEGGLLTVTALFDDRYGLAWLPLDAPEDMAPIPVEGLRHDGVGEMETIEHLADDRYLLTFNIDGVSWAYEIRVDEAALRAEVLHVLVGEGELGNGVLEAIRYDELTGDFALAFSSAVTPVQIYTIEGAERRVVRQTEERVLGIPESYLSPGEDASFDSHDGLRVSARLYLPDSDLQIAPPFPVIYYIHGGPQSQERPDFTWFSMPLIQFFTLNGFAVFVPNVRGSTGYGLSYMKRVDRDWGGQDRLDHVAAVERLREDPRLDTTRMGVMGRSYGGYMTLTLVGRHPELWGAACDMFGPYDLHTFIDRLPATWQTYFHQAVGHPERDAEALRERSPRTYIESLACPLLVIQGANDPRVVERESRDVVEQLQAHGKVVDYLLFDDEGHDVLKFANKVRCFNEIVDFFKQHLGG